MNLFNLFAKLTLDTDEYDKQLDSAGKKGSSFSSKLGTVMKAGAKAVIGLTTAVAGATLAFGKLTLKMVDTAGEIDDNAQRLNMTTDQYQLWSFAMQKAGADASALEIVMRELTTFTTELSQGQGDALLTLQKLGVGYEDFIAMDNATQLETIVGALQGMENQTEKTRLAQELFGNRAYQTLMPLLNEEQGSIEKLNETMREQGLIVEEDLIKTGAELGDQVDIMKGKFKAYSLSLTAEVFPALENIVNGLLGIAQGSEGATEQFTTGIVEMVDKAVEVLPELLDVAGDLLVNVIVALVNSLPSIVPKLTSLIQAVLLTIVNILPDILSAAGVAVDMLLDVIVALLDSLPAIMPQLASLIESILFKIVDILPTILLSAVNLIAPILDAVLHMDWLGLLTAIIDMIVNELPNILITLVTSVFDVLLGMLAEPTFFAKIGLFGVNLGISLVNGLIEGLNRLANITIPGLNIAGWQVWEDTQLHLFNIPKIPLQKFADGGMFDDMFKGTMYAVAGEGSAEIVAQGRYDTGVANVEQIADAQLLAMQRYDMRGEVRRAVEGIVNGLKSSNTSSDNIQSMLGAIVLKIGDKEFKAYVYQVINEVLATKGLKNLQAIGRY